MGVRAQGVRLRRDYPSTGSIVLFLSQSPARRSRIFNFGFRISVFRFRVVELEVMDYDERPWVDMGRQHEGVQPTRDR